MGPRLRKYQQVARGLPLAASVAPSQTETVSKIKAQSVAEGRASGVAVCRVTGAHVEESLLDSVRLAEMDSVGLVHVALPRADAPGSSLGQRSAEGKGDPGAVSPENSESWAAHGSVRKRLARLSWIYSSQVLDDSSARPRSRILTAGAVPSRSSQSQVKFLCSGGGPSSLQYPRYSVTTVGLPCAVLCSAV
jgi:hypothetical protein